MDSGACRWRWVATWSPIRRRYAGTDIVFIFGSMGRMRKSSDGEPGLAGGGPGRWVISDGDGGGAEGLARGDGNDCAARLPANAHWSHNRPRPRAGPAT